MKNMYYLDYFCPFQANMYTFLGEDRKEIVLYKYSNNHEVKYCPMRGEYVKIYSTKRKTWHIKI